MHPSALGVCLRATAVRDVCNDITNWLGNPYLVLEDDISLLGAANCEPI